MKKGIFTLVVLFFQLTIGRAQVNPSSVRVNGYIRSNGTYVQPHHRTSSNGTINDNYTTYPTVNPYTGRQGRISPDRYTAPRSYNAPRVQTYSTPRIPNYSTPRVYRPRGY